MNLGLRTLSDRDAARELLPLLEVAVVETSLAYSDVAVPSGTAERYLERHFDHPATCIVVAESSDSSGSSGSSGSVLAMAGTAPFIDPLTGDVEPMLVLLWVEASIRHRGVARALVAELRRRLSARGLGSLAARASHTDDALTSMGERWGLVREWSFLSSG